MRYSPSISRLVRLASARVGAATLVLTGFFGCSSSAAPGPGGAPPCAAAPYADHGPFSAGVTTLDIDGVVTEVWYPAPADAASGKPRVRYDMRDWLPAAERGKISDADAPLYTTDAVRDLPVAKGPFPLVVFSHGLGGYRMQSTFLMTHLASWGFVVAAPEHIERGLAIVLAGDFSKIDTSKSPDQLRAVLERLQKEAATPSSRFEGTVDTTRVAMVGHSMGGATASALATDSRVRVTVLLASPGMGELPADKPALFVWGSRDGVASSSNIEAAFDKQTSPRRSIGIRGAGHLAFTDLCVIGRDKGGVLGVAESHGIAVNPLVKRLANDGCGTSEDGEPYLSPERGWRVIDEYVTAQLRAALGVDGRPTGLDQESAKCFQQDVEKLVER